MSLLTSSTGMPSVAFVGLGAMGFGMATHLITSGYIVHGYDVYPPTLERFAAVNGRPAKSPREATTGCAILVVMVANAKQAEFALFDSKSGAINTLSEGATILVCSTVPHAFLDSVQARLNALGRKDLCLIDAPVSGGTIRAANGTLTILASGSLNSLQAGDGILRQLSEKLYIVDGGLGQSSKVKAVNQALAGIHIVAAAEAMGLAAKAGLDTREVYNIIANAAGNSWMFENRVTHMLDNDLTPHSALDIFVKDMGIVTSSAKAQGFPVPLSGTVEQLYVNASARGWGRDDDSSIVRLYLGESPTQVHDLAGSSAIPKTEITPTTTPVEISKIGFIGLGAMGSGQATSLCRAGFAVTGFDVWTPSIESFVGSGEALASAAKSSADAAQSAQVLIIMVQSAAQVENALFGPKGALETLPSGSVVIVNSTVSPDFIRRIEKRIKDLGRDIGLVDAPVSGGVIRAANGKLTIISSGSERALAKAKPALVAMSGLSSNLYTVRGGVGAGSSIKMVNQMLAGIHIVAAAESMAFGATLGLDTGMLYEIIKNAAGGSWMFENRVPAMLNADWTPHSALAIFLKDLGIVLDEAQRLRYPAHLTQAAFQIYQLGNSMAKEADAGVVRVWEKMTGVSVAASNSRNKQQPYKPVIIPLQETLNSLPPPYTGDVIPIIQKRVANPSTPVLVVLDDDPTGTQTCHNVEVTTVWDHETLVNLFQTPAKGWFVLTNSRALNPSEARKIIATIVQNVVTAAKEAGKEFEIVLRGDSTLRGHFPDEPEVVEEVLGKTDGWILAPFFYQGGRYTINDIHYVAEGDELVPAGMTPFAQDASFGYSPEGSHLRNYIMEKAPGKFIPEQIVSITLDDIRRGGPQSVTAKLLSFAKGSIIIVNAQVESDMHVFSAGLLDAEDQGRKYLFRTAAAFVSSRLGIQGKPPMTASDLMMDCGLKSAGGLIIAGSYVPKTTAQLKSLISGRGDSLHVIELDVEQLLSDSSLIISSAAVDASHSILTGKDVLVMTSRKLITGSTASSSLQIGAVVAQALVEILKEISVRPRYIIAKGGITSSDAASKGLNMKRATIVGQAAPGVPLWKCTETTSRFAEVPYVVFPGNVGGDDTLADLVAKWARFNVM